MTWMKGGVYESMANSHPTLQKGEVRCRTCDKEKCQGYHVDREKVEGFPESIFIDERYRKK